MNKQILFLFNAGQFPENFKLEDLFRGEGGGGSLPLSIGREAE